VQLFIDLKPALTEEQLDKRLLRDFEENRNKQFKNALSDLLPSRLIPVMIELSGISPDKKVNELTKAERLAFGHLLKNVPLTIDKAGDFKEAIITQGGVHVKEINPSTMESKRVKNLYFAGECIDVDALTGGFNLHIAFSTGWLAGQSAAGSSSR
jgi:predicted Rossmann fold flavoprotein